MKFKVGVETVSAYKRLSYTPWHAIAEFIDNSTQAYFDNKAALDATYGKEGTGLEVNVLYDRNAGTLTIKDNSIGMSLPEVEVALEVACRPPRPSGRSKYGMGLKTASCWFGNRWQLKTKKLGDTREITVSINVEEIAAGEVDLIPQIVDTGDPSNSYTELTISELNKKLTSRTVGKIKAFLRSMYRCDLREGVMKLYWQNSPLTWDGVEDKLLRGADGLPYRKDLNFEVLGHKVHGWVGILGSGSRALAGFSILQYKRVVRGYPDSWRPEELFGQLLGSNDLVNQRLVGELHLDTFQVSHTKDDINWVGEEEDAVEKALLEHCRDYRTVAATPYKNMDDRHPKTEVVDAAVDQLVRDLSSHELVDKIELSETPPEEVVEETFQTVVDQETGNEPRVDIQVGKRRLKVHLGKTASFNDPYVAIDITPDETIVVVINMNHPYLKFLDEASSMTDYLRQCVFDAIAMDMARIQKGKVHYTTVQMHKDRLLRVPHEIHDLEPDAQWDETEDPIPV